LASRWADIRRVSVLALCGVCAASLALADGASAQLPPILPFPAPPPPSPAPDAVPGTPSSKVRVASTGASAEIPQALPIARHPGRSKVIASLRPHALPSLEAGDQLQVSAEAELTTDCLRRLRGSSECRGKAYRFNPRIGAKLILADHAGATKGLALSQRKRVICRQKLPSREHHCYMTLTPAPLLVSDESALGCAESCRVNLVMDAFNRRARPGNVLLVGGNNGGDKVKQDKASVDAIRIRPPDPSQVPPPPPIGSTTTVTTERLITGLSLDHPPRRAVVYSQQLDGLRKGEQLGLRAELTTGVIRLRHNAKTGSSVILADDPLDTSPGQAGIDVTGENGEITENNGFNCTQRTSPCETAKIGVFEVAQDAPGTLYVNVIVSVGRVGGRAPGDNSVTVQEGGGLEVVRYPADQKG
jgi:hypothetical protein